MSILHLPMLDLGHSAAPVLLSQEAEDLIVSSGWTAASGH